MVEKKRLVFLGAPGAGKGTMAHILSDDTNIIHLSTGDIFRKEIANQTELGGKAKSYVDVGNLVPDELVTDMVVTRLLEDDCITGFILDGFPRTLNQATLLEEALNNDNIKLDAVVLFNVNEDLLISRLTARLTCKKCGVNFNKLFTPPAKEGVCDKCDGVLYQRSDDSLETVLDRLKVYNTQTKPLIDFYDNKNLLLSMNAEATKDINYIELKRILK